MISLTAALRAQARASRSAAVRTVAVAVVATTACAGAHVDRATSTPVPTPSLTLSSSTSPTAGAWHGSPGQSLVALAKRSTVRVTSANGTRTWKLSNPNDLGAPLVFLVVGGRSGAWEVRVPARPNGSVGWVSARDVEVQVDDYALRVSLSKHRLSVYRDATLVKTYPVGVGRPSAPTPTGHYYLTELLQSPNPHGPYGPYAYGTSAFSNTYSEFEGGPGQIGMHGTNDPSSINHNVSHGCIRLNPSDVKVLAHMIPAGTPLTITS